MRKLAALCSCTILLLGLVGCSTQPAETAVPESSAAQTETQTEALIPSSSAEESSSGIPTTKAVSTEESQTESSVPEESTDDPTAEPSAESSASGASTEDTAAETSTDAETNAESSDAAETAETSENAETAEVPGNERTVFGFRFTVPDGWEKQEDGSYLADEGRVLIDFFLLPAGEAFSAGTAVSSESFAAQLVALLNEGADNDGIYELYHSALLHTKSGLENCFVMLKYNDREVRDHLFIFSAYDRTDNNFFIIRISFGLDASVRGEECWELINSTIERID